MEGLKPAYQMPYSYIISKEGIYIKARDPYGRVQFSSTDAATTIQNALNALTSGVVFIKAGTYTLSSGLTVPANVGIQGEGRNTILYYPSHTDGATVVLLDGDYSFLDSVTVKATTGWSPASFFLVVTDGNYIRVPNCYLTDSAYDGILTRNGHHVMIVNNVVENCDDDGINPSTGSTLVTIMGNVIRGITHDGIHLARGGETTYDLDMSVIGNVISDSGGGILLYTNNIKASITGNTVKNCTYGIRGLTDTGLVSIVGNLVDSCTEYGIQILGNKVTINGNTIINGSYGIYVSSSGFASIIGNLINNCTTYGINILSGTGNLTISGNTIINAADTWGVYFVGSDSVISENIVSGGKRGIYVGADVTAIKNIINHNKLADCSDYGIVLSYPSVVDSYNLVEGNTISGPSTGILLYQAKSNRITNNRLLNCTTPISGIANNTVKNNDGYVTEASGTATILNGNTSVTFAHGLAGTPTSVVLGATHSEVADATWSADATNITITVPSAVTADRDISWYAEYKP